MFARQDLLRISSACVGFPAPRILGLFFQNWPGLVALAAMPYLEVLVASIRVLRPLVYEYLMESIPKTVFIQIGAERRAL